ncbi:hypothetical protein B0H14DRAFT_3499414 [Mycena olivaceomarginata]|nr:hypothetical protein B0H14DRAFT_3499414 [Mycena olivaceomarginata]
MIDTDENFFNHTIEHVSIVHIAGNRNETHFHAAPSVDPTSRSSSGRPSQKYREQTPPSSILGVAIAFHDPPCVLQISLILRVQWTQVGAPIWPISSYFEHLNPTINFNSDVKLRPVLKDFLVRKPGRCGSTPRSTTPSLRNGIWPASLATHGEFWDYHVCNVNPSTEIWDALRSSCLPLDPVSRLKLTRVIRWLEEEQAADFLATYRQQSNNPPQPVLTMGGMVDMLF